MCKRSSLLFALGVSAGLMADVSAGPAQAETIKIGGPPLVWGAGVYFGAQEKLGIDPAFNEIKGSGPDGYRFPIQYESGPPIVRPEPQPAAPVRTKRRSRSQPPQPSPKTTVGR